MKNLISSFKKIRLTRVIAVLFAVAVLFMSNINPAQAKEPIGERIGEQLHETSVKSERPKTVGELKAEADGDVPLGERMKNITRDSKEAFGQFGQGITTSIKETAKELGGNVKEAGKDLDINR